MSLESIISLLRERIGLEPNSLGENTVAQIIKRRMADCHLEEVGHYRQMLETSPEEWGKLVEEVVIPETWFFRDWEPFVFLGDYAISKWLPAHRGRVFHVLSVPSSTGEEPYSIAMTLLDRGFTGEMFHIDTIDISHKALEGCRRAVYGSNSFRGEEVGRFQNRYFQKTPEGYRLLPEVCEQVRFMQANLLESRLPVGEQIYDAIFCRNMLIYFDDTARQRTIAVLRRLLADDGLLFAGYAEAMIMLQSGFAAVDHPRAFAYRERKPAPRHEEVFRGDRPPARFPRRASLKSTSPPRVRRSTSDANTPAEPAVPVKESDLDKHDPEPTPIEQARCFADKGRLEEAVAICRSMIEQETASAECYCLLGLIHEASGERGEAEGCFDKALYLDPDYEEAMIHLALILEFRGDTSRADVLRDRASRVEQTSRTKEP